jgi:hypothetical protein
MNTDKLKVASIVFVLALCFYAAWRGNDWYEANYEYPLATVIYVGNADEVERLVGMGANIERPGDGESTPIHLAAKHGQMEIAEFLLAEGARLDVRDEDGDSPLRTAARSGNAEFVELFLAHGADKNARNVSDSTPLVSAASRGHTRTVGALLDHDAAFDDESSALHAAVRNEHTETVALLLDWGFDPNVGEKLGHPPLHMAASQGLYNIVSLLLGHGARTGVPASLVGKVRTPIFQAARNFSNVENAQKVIDLLLEHGAQMTIWEEVMMGKAAELRVRLEGDPKLAVTPDDSGFMPLRFAILSGHSSVVETLVEFGADFSTPGLHGYTPLTLAASIGHVDIVEILIDVGADLNAADRYGRAPLIEAAEYGHTNVVRALLEHGADPFALRPKRSRTAFRRCSSPSPGHSPSIDRIRGGTHSRLPRRIWCSPDNRRYREERILGGQWLRCD